MLNMNTIRIQGESDEVRVGKILCLGRNYMEHVKEMKSETPTAPVVFLKPPTALIRNGEPIVFPPISKQLHHEVEIVLLIGKNGKNIAVGRGDEYVYGYGIGLDMTLRDIQSEAKKRGLPWSVAKGFDTSAPVSDIVRAERIKDPSALSFRCLVNGSVRQSGAAREMLIAPSGIIEYISTIFTLERGDLIFTGTPEGVGDVHPGDTITAELDGYAVTTNPVVAG
jgi:5-carboxymethyl-2-hydroxymuconate isomerase